MKIRNGFVSNSSSSSFCILGTVINEDCLSKEMLKLWEESPYRVLGKELIGSDLSYHYGISNYEENEVIIGVSAYNLEENKTIKQQKVEIAEKISKIFKKEIDISLIQFHIDGGYER